MSFVDILVAVEILSLVVFGIPLSIRGTIRLVQAVRASTTNDRLARVVTLYLGLVTEFGLYLLGLGAFRLVYGYPPPDWVRPITYGLLEFILIGPWYIDRVAGQEKE